MIGQIDIEKTLQLQPNKECLFVSVATILNHVVDVVNELQATISKMEKVEPTKNVQPDYVTTTYVTDGHTKEYYGQNGASIATDYPLPAGYIIAINEPETKGGDK